MTPNVIVIPNFLTSTDNLFDDIINLDFDRSMKARWTASFGKSYDYSGMSYPAITFPTFLSDLINPISDIVNFTPNNCLINLYHDGRSSMGYHSDNTDILTPGTGVVIISLGSTRTLRFKNKLDNSIIVDYTLDNGSLFYMDDSVQNDWLHSIPKSDTLSPRLSLTFRNIL
jgi:alkylated DNA repair dioxygenase AlkB